MANTKILKIIGGGMAGCEAAWQAANMGVHVHLYEMRPKVKTLAHNTEYLAKWFAQIHLGQMIMNIMPLVSYIGKCMKETA